MHHPEPAELLLGGLKLYGIKKGTGTLLGPRPPSGSNYFFPNVTIATTSEMPANTTMMVSNVVNPIHLL